MRPTLVNVQFRLSSPFLSFYVDVRLRNFNGRWLAVADIAGDKEIGMGRGTSEALAACLSSLGPSATAALLPDPQLLGVSQRLSYQSNRVSGLLLTASGWPAGR